MVNELSLLTFLLPSRHLKKLENLCLATESGHKPIFTGPVHHPVLGQKPSLIPQREPLINKSGNTFRIQVFKPHIDSLREL